MKKLLLGLGGLALVAGAALAMMGLSGGGSSKPGKLRLQIETKPVVMSASYKVHANKELKDGRYWVTKLLLTNEGPGNVDDVRVSYRIPNISDWTTPQPYPTVLPEQTVVDLYYPRLPSSLSEKLTGSTEQVEIKINYNAGGEAREELRKIDFELLGRNDLVYTTMDSDEISSITDVYENTDLLASFVTPEDPVIKYFTQQLQQKVLGGMGFDAGSNPKEAMRFMEGLYNYQLAAGLVYANTLGLPVKYGDSYSVVQKVRMPREVLTGEAGLCVELSTLFASVALSAGLKPVIFLTAGHAWPGIRLDDGNIIPIEATMIGGEGLGGRADFQAAVETGLKNMQVFAAGGGDSVGGPSIGLLDVSALHTSGIRPPELPDDEGLRKDIDDTLKELMAGAAKAAKQPQPTRRANNNNGGDTRRNQPNPAPPPGPSIPAGFARHQGPGNAYSMAYPSNWTAQVTPLPQFPQLTSVLAQNPGGLGPAVEVYMLPGVGSANEAIDFLAYAISNYGGYMQAVPAGQTRIKGVGYQAYNGQTNFNGVAVEWRGYFHTQASGTVGVVISAPMGSLGGMSALLNQIADTFTIQ
ncbi:MAG: hypothetical protein AAGC71_00200 [Pseudomonadota bacterium]